jgi:uncharacterized membrane protein
LEYKTAPIVRKPNAGPADNASFRSGIQFFADVEVVFVAVVVVMVVVAVPVVVVVVFFHGRIMVHGTLGTHKPFNLSAANNPSSMNASTGAGLPFILIATM